MQIPRSRLLLTGIIVTLGGSFHFGFNMTLVNPTTRVFQDFLNVSMKTHFRWRIDNLASRFLWSAIAGSLLFGAAIGALLVPMLMDQLGRKKGLIISAILLGISSPISGLSKLPNWIEMFALGRFLCGIGCGMTMVCQAVYLTEISPIKYRGLMGMLIGCAVEIGYTMGNILGLPVLLGTEQRWPIIFAIDFVPSILLLAFLFTAKESPAYLLAKGNIKSATESILYYYGKTEDTALALRRIEQDLQRTVPWPFPENPKCVADEPEKCDWGNVINHKVEVCSCFPKFTQADPYKGNLCKQQLGEVACKLSKRSSSCTLKQLCPIFCVGH